MFYATSDSEGVVMPLRAGHSGSADGVVLDFTGEAQFLWNVEHLRNTDHVK
jgi:hypothetical protein